MHHIRSVCQTTPDRPFGISGTDPQIVVWFHRCPARRVPALAPPPTVGPPAMIGLSGGLPMLGIARPIRRLSARARCGSKRSSRMARLRRSRPKQALRPRAAQRRPSCSQTAITPSADGRRAGRPLGRSLRSPSVWSGSEVDPHVSELLDTANRRGPVTRPRRSPFPAQATSFCWTA
jgi:hypothetical protein